MGRVRRKKSEPGRIKIIIIIIIKKEVDPVPPKRDLKLEALIPYLEGKKTIVLAAESPSDLQTAVSLANEFHLKFVLNHIAHSQPVLDYVASLKCPSSSVRSTKLPKKMSVTTPSTAFPRSSTSAESKSSSPPTPPTTSATSPTPPDSPRLRPPLRRGAKSNHPQPAEVWGVADQLGSLDVGKTANIVVANGDPLDVKTDVKQVFIQGREIPMTSRQTQLRDEYSK